MMDTQVVLFGALCLSLLSGSLCQVSVEVDPFSYGFESEEVKIGCSVSGANETFVFTWYSGSEIIYRRGQDKIITPGDKFNDGRVGEVEMNTDWSTLKFKPSKTDDFDKEYTCEVDGVEAKTMLKLADTEGTIMIKKIQHVSAKTDETNELDSNATVYPGDHLILEALASGYLPLAQIVWFRGNDSLEAGEGIGIKTNYSSSNVNGLSRPTISTLDYTITSEDAGKVFGCRVRLLGKSYQQEYVPFGLTVGEESGMHPGVIIAIVVVFILIPVCAGVLCWYWKKRNMNKKGKMEINEEKEDVAEKGELLDATGEANTKPDETEQETKENGDKASREQGDGKEQLADKE